MAGKKFTCKKNNFFCKSLDIQKKIDYNSVHKQRELCFKTVSLAQPVEHLPFKEVAVGSNPTRDTIYNSF